MNDMFWNLFVQNGSVEAYLAYRGMWADTMGYDYDYEMYKRVEGIDDAGVRHSGRDMNFLE